MDLHVETRTDLDISSEAEVLRFTYSGDDRETVIRSQLTGIVGSDNYLFHVYINDVLVSPSGNLAVGAVTDTIFISRIVPLKDGDVVSLGVLGPAGDTAVDCTTFLRDFTPVAKADLVGGGPVAVDHDYGSSDRFTVALVNGSRVQGATIWVFREDDYSIGRRSREYALGETRTDSNGRWVEPLMLSPGRYTLLVFKQGVIKPKAAGLVVE